MRLISYTRVSTEQQGASGLGEDAQLESIRKAAEYHGYEIVNTFNDVISSRQSSRPGWENVKSNLFLKHADGVIVAKLDRISRSVKEGAEIFEDFKRNGWEIVVNDLGVDTSTAAGKLVATVMMAVAEWERDVISQRTSDALQAKIAAGAKLGRPYSKPDPRAIRIMESFRYQSVSWITGALNDAEIPSITGGRWHESTVRRHMCRLNLL